MEKLFQKYIDDNCSFEELLVVLEWLNTERGQKFLSSKMDDEWDKLILDEKKLSIKPPEDKLKVTYSRKKNLKKGILYLLGGLSAAAAVVVLLLTTNPFDQEVTLEQSHALYEIKQNPPGIKSTIRLPDGSIVVLNSDSEIKYEDNFLQNRQVYLKGEAFFEVIENSQSPFVVRIEDLSIHALGTSFNVKAFGELPNINICLTEGKVKVEHMNQVTEISSSLLLDPGEKVIFAKDDKLFTKTIFDPNIDLAWKSKTIVFDSSDFQEIRSTLERWYGVQIIIDSSLTANWEFTGRFSNTTLDNILKNMVYSRGLAYELDGETVNIYLPVK